MRNLIFIALSLFAGSLSAQDSVTFINKKTGVKFIVTEMQLTTVKLKNGVKFNGYPVFINDSVIAFREANYANPYAYDRQEMLKIHQNKNLSRQQQIYEIQKLIYSDTNYYKYDSIKRLKVMRNDKTGKILMGGGGGIVLGSLIMAAMVGNSTQPGEKDFAWKFPVTMGVHFLGDYFFLKGFRKHIYARKWRLKAD